MELNLRKNVFTSYDCSSEKKIVRKYDLRRFMGFSYLFEHAKGNLHLVVDPECLKIKYQPAENKVTEFSVQGIYMDDKEEDDIARYGFVRDK
jgi:hypothetical protein